MFQRMILCCLILPLLTVACRQHKGYQGQAPAEVVPTVDLPIQKQWKGIWAFEDSTLFFSNDFEGARLNGVASDGNAHYTLLISAENTPINPSPWYAFKVWSSTPREVVLKLTFQHSRARYYPKVSQDGVHFTTLDSSLYTPISPGSGLHGIESVPESFEIRLKLAQQTIWVCAQELYTSSNVHHWMDSLAMAQLVKLDTIGYSKQNRPIALMEFGNASAKKAIIIISRQHPPEVTGFLAMKSFVETLAYDASPTATMFRETFMIYAVPLMNPDGVDNGHWRHNMGGVDLNRDWQNFHQPETAALRDFLLEKEKEGRQFVFGVDFHSTWDDIYYPLDTAVTTNADEMVIYDWMAQISKRLPQKQTNIKASGNVEPTMVSRNYFYLQHDMPAIVFELGDNTPRGFLKEKGTVAGEELMTLLLKEHTE